MHTNIELDSLTDNKTEQALEQLISNYYEANIPAHLKSRISVAELAAELHLLTSGSIENPEDLAQFSQDIIPIFSKHALKKIKVKFNEKILPYSLYLIKPEDRWHYFSNTCDALNIIHNLPEKTNDVSFTHFIIAILKWLPKENCFSFFNQLDIKNLSATQSHALNAFLIEHYPNKETFDLHVEKYKPITINMLFSITAQLLRHCTDFTSQQDIIPRCFDYCKSYENQISINDVKELLESVPENKRTVFFFHYMTNDFFDRFLNIGVIFDYSSLLEKIILLTSASDGKERAPYHNDFYLIPCIKNLLKIIVRSVLVKLKKFGNYKETVSALQMLGQFLRAHPQEQLSEIIDEAMIININENLRRLQLALYGSILQLHNDDWLFSGFSPLLNALPTVERLRLFERVREYFPILSLLEIYQLITCFPTSKEKWQFLQLCKIELNAACKIKNVSYHKHILTPLKTLYSSLEPAEQLHFGLWLSLNNIEVDALTNILQSGNKEVREIIESYVRCQSFLSDKKDPFKAEDYYERLSFDKRSKEDSEFEKNVLYSPSFYLIPATPSSVSIPYIYGGGIIRERLEALQTIVPITSAPTNAQTLITLFAGLRENLAQDKKEINNSSYGRGFPLSWFFSPEQQQFRTREQEIRMNISIMRCCFKTIMDSIQEPRLSAYLKYK
jgi:hypothetical protein